MSFVAIVSAMFLWTGYVLFAVRVLGNWHAEAAGCLTAAGAALLVIALMMPEWPAALRSLDRPLNLAPATETMLFALQTYVGLRLHFGGSAFVGVLLLAGGVLMKVRSRRRLIGL